MAINPIKFIVSPSVTATNGSDTITVTGNVDCSKVYSGTVVSINGKQIVEAISGTPADGSGNSTITLRSNWTQVTTTSDMVAFNSIEGLSEAIRRARELVENINALDLLAGQGVIHKEPNGEYVLKEITTSAADTTAGRLLKVGDFNLGVGAPTKADFFALAEKRIRDNAGSGFAEWGKHTPAAGFEIVNEGLHTYPLNPNLLLMGRAIDVDRVGVSRTDNAYLNVNGSSLKLADVANGSGYNSASIAFPPAPNGTKTYDSSTGAVVTHGSSAAAFAAETATNKVIISRQDFVFLESWHEKISDKDVVYPLGNVQYGVTTWNSIALSNALVAQGYSAFGEWDTATTGYGVVWSTLSDADKVKFLQDPENNIYNDNGELVQVRYRIRVIEGLGDNWGSVGVGAVGWKHYSHPNCDLQAQGQLIDVGTDLLPAATYGGYREANPYAQTGAYFAADTSVLPDNTKGHNGLCFAIPIALVQRRNLGIYTPTHNPNGTWLVGRNDGSTNGENWYSSIAYTMTNTADCFNTALRAKTLEGGMIGGVSGRPDGKFYDAIYASDVQDLRMSANKLPIAEIRETYKRKAIAGEVRGFEGVPFTDLFDLGKTGRSTGLTNQGIIAYTVADSNLAKYDWMPKTAGTTTVVTPCVGGVVIGGVPYAIDGAMRHATLTDLVYLRLKSREPISADALSVDAVIGRLQYNHKQAKPTWTDIIGDPANIAATFPNGVEGQWIPVIPTASSTPFPLNRKSLTANGTQIYTSNNGSSWASASITSINTTSNSTPNTGGTTTVQLWHYETQAHFTQDAVNSKVLDLSKDASITGAKDSNRGNILCSSLIGKIGTAADTAKQSTMLATTVYAGKLITDGGTWKQEHVSGIFPISASPTVKTLDYLSSANNVATLHYAYKEMVYDATWGDNNQFEITDNQGSQLDDNGNTVLYGTASFNTQYFVVEQ